MELKINGFNKIGDNSNSKKEVYKSEKGNSFNDMLNIVSSSRVNSRNDNTKSLKDNEKIALDKKDIIGSKDNVFSKLSKDDIQTIKNKLEEAGFSKEELEGINTIKDLEKLGDKLKDNGEVDLFILFIAAILQMLCSVQNMGMDKEIGAKIAEIKALLKSLSKDSPNRQQIIDKINKLLSEITELMKNKPENSLDKDLLETLLNKLNSEIKNEVKQGPNEEKVSFLNSIKKEIQNLLNDKVDSNKLPAEEKINLDKLVISEEKSDSSNLKENTSNEDKVLKGLLEDNDTGAESKINKTVNFMSHFKNATNVNELSSKEALGNLVVNKNTMNADIIKAIRYMDVNNIKDLTVKIMPKELGEIFIKITMDGGIMKANISAANKEAYALLNSNMHLIDEKLQNSGLKIQELSLNVYQEDTTFFKESNEKRRNSYHDETDTKTGSTSSEEEIIEEKVSSIDSNVNMLA